MFEDRGTRASRAPEGVRVRGLGFRVKCLATSHQVTLNVARLRKVDYGVGDGTDSVWGLGVRVHVAGVGVDGGGWRVEGLWFGI